MIPFGFALRSLKMMRGMKMPKFVVYESAQTVYMYEIVAETKDDAHKIVDEGYVDPVRTEYIEREIYEIVEVGND